MTIARPGAATVNCDAVGPPVGARVALQPDFLVLVDEAFLVGYGLGAVEQINRISLLAAANSADNLSQARMTRLFSQKR